MDTATCFRAQAHNNAWANHRLLTACGQLSQGALDEARTGFFPSIMATLDHILLVDAYYVGGIEGRADLKECLERPPLEAFADLERQQRSVDRRLIGICSGLTDAAMARMVDLPRTGWVQTERVDRILLHLFQHQVHHRGQVHAMLAGTSIAPPQLDEFFLDHEKERALRAEEFAALGFKEDAIWEAAMGRPRG